ncbi:Regulatory protein IclR (plasmid) [Mesorhizobium loti]|nr:Regulatory protein IclR [Mesorhizobium loti]
MTELQDARGTALGTEPADLGPLAAPLGTLLLRAKAGCASNPFWLLEQKSLQILIIRNLTAPGGVLDSSSNAARALEILLALGEADADGLPLGEIAIRVGEAKPAVHRSLASLPLKGFAEPTGRHGHLGSG